MPRGLPLEGAALYVGVAPSTWLREVKAGRAPKPVHPTRGRAVWLREHLDTFLDDCAAKAEDRQVPNPWDGPAR